MADEEPKNAPSSDGLNGEDETPQIVVPSHAPLPLPPEVHYSRPTTKRPAASADTRRSSSPRGPSSDSDDGSGFTNLGSGMAAATTFVASVVAGFLIGQWIDHRWPGATPWGTLVFSLLGVAAGFLNLFRVLAATDRSRKK